MSVKIVPQLGYFFALLRKDAPLRSLRSLLYNNFVTEFIIFRTQGSERSPDDDEQMGTDFEDTVLPRDQNSAQSSRRSTMSGRQSVTSNSEEFFYQQQEGGLGTNASSDPEKGTDLQGSNNRSIKGDEENSTEVSELVITSYYL